MWGLSGNEKMAVGRTTEVAVELAPRVRCTSLANSLLRPSYSEPCAWLLRGCRNDVLGWEVVADAAPRHAEYQVGQGPSGSYDTRRSLSHEQLNTLSGLAHAPETQLVWFTSVDEKKAFGHLTIQATEVIIADPQRAADDFAWYRTNWHEIQARKDGITIDPSGQSPLIRALAKILPVSCQQNNDGWLSGTRQTQIPTAAAFGLVLVRDPLDPVQRLGSDVSGSACTCGPQRTAWPCSPCARSPSVSTGSDRSACRATSPPRWPRYSRPGGTRL